MVSPSPYESPALREITGPTIRPGGFSLTARAVEFCGLKKGAAVLDVGCGPGATANWLKGNHGLDAVGLDASLTLLREGRCSGSAAFLVAGRAGELPFRSGCFDGLFCECVLSLLEAPGRALVEFKRVLRPGGWLVVTDLYARRPEGVTALWNLPQRSCLQGAGSRAEMLSRIAGAGFEPMLWEDHSGLLRQLAARLVFEFGSMARLQSFFAPGCSGDEWRWAMDSARPGYCLMIARKRGDDE